MSRATTLVDTASIQLSVDEMGVGARAARKQRQPLPPRNRSHKSTTTRIPRSRLLESSLRDARCTTKRRRRVRRWCAQGSQRWTVASHNKRLDFVFKCVVEFLSIGSEELDAVVRSRVVTCGNHYAHVSAASHLERDSRCRHNPGHCTSTPACGQPTDNRSLELRPGRAGVTTNTAVFGRSTSGSCIGKPRAKSGRGRSTPRTGHELRPVPKSRTT